MTKFIETFKTRAKNKSLTSADMLALCIYKTMNAKSEHKEVILKHFITKAFTGGKICAHRPHPYYSAHMAMSKLQYQVQPHRRWDLEKNEIVKSEGSILNIERSEIFTEEEYIMFMSLLSKAIEIKKEL